MDSTELKTKIEATRHKLNEVHRIASVVDTQDWLGKIEEGDFSARKNLYEVDSELAESLVNLKGEIEGNLPSGYRVGGDLLRHLHWMQVTDLFDIYNSDIATELAI